MGIHPLMVDVQMGGGWGVLYGRLGKTSILSVFEKIFKIPSGYVHLFSLPFLSSKKFIKSTANTPCFGRLKSRSNTPPICQPTSLYILTK